MLYCSYPEVASFVMWTAATYSQLISSRAFFVSKHLLTMRSVSCPADLWFIRCMSCSSSVSCEGLPDINGCELTGTRQGTREFRTKHMPSAQQPYNQWTPLSGGVHSKFCVCSKIFARLNGPRLARNVFAERETDKKRW